MKKRDKITTFNIYKSKKWASLVITLTYWLLLLTAATNLIYLILSTQLGTWSWERYNMAYFAAEWWIEQAIYETNVHWIWFSWAIATNNLNERIEYQWESIWRKAWSQSWYLVIWDHPNKIDYIDKDLWKYLSSRRFHFYYDNWVPWSVKESIPKTSSCLNSNQIQVTFSVSWSSINNSNTNRIIYWKLDMKDTNDQWSWFTLQPRWSCNDSLGDPICYNNWFTPWVLDFSTSEWNCKDDILNNCIPPARTIPAFWWGSNNLIIPANIYKPYLLLSYVSPLYDSNNPNIFYPILYTIDWTGINTCQFPTTTIKLKWVGQVRWAKMEVTATISQEEGTTMFDYAVIQ